MTAWRRGTALLALAWVVCLPLQAQDWPAKPVTIVVPWPPGGPSDTVARPMAKGLTEALGKSFVVDNRGGAGGNIGSAAVAKAAPDGSMLLITSSAPIVINPHIYKKMPYEAQKDLAPVTNLLRVPLVLAVHPSVPAKNLKELIAHIQSQKGKFQYASSGNGTPQHMTGELFKMTAKLDMAHVPYKGSATAINDVLAGHAPMMFDSTVAILPHIKAGKLKAIAVTGAQRSPQLPEVPTFAEAGLPGVESYAWYGLFAPGKTPKALVARINAEALKVMKGDEYQRVLKETGSEFVGDTPENFAAFVKTEADKWGKVAKATGATVD
ncbi:Bug family tripartite tricarboxylate transporter substrate binding protein [Azohydromonas caseinilytica]|uniref:Tripartite tricarboxylate transporter substrate binding protein n=1 Tax=Azohydromonas caseinilytica TaxID=2728836 RepID=A0A848FAK8_9BURK|nr:tripartite tricarboxylate transporter substrate binding protein [Azohydromonas caseinilytica]NML15785.1 tripartite tricarboxylate transporter substrate binding protein [Azohydromonas caseinilytica]